VPKTWDSSLLTDVSYIWMGVLMGFGYEISFFVLWLFWRVTHSKVARRVGEDHWIHFLAEYFK